MGLIGYPKISEWNYHFMLCCCMYCLFCIVLRIVCV